MRLLAASLQGSNLIWSRVLGSVSDYSWVYSALALAKVFNYPTSGDQSAGESKSSNRGLHVGQSW